MKELLKRSITGFIYGLILIGSILLHPLAFLLVYLAITLLAMNEFLLISRKEGSMPSRLPVFLLISASFVLWFFHNYSNWPLWLFSFLPIIIFSLYLTELYKKAARPFINLSFAFLGLIYVGLPLALINELVFSPYSAEYSAQPLLFLFMVLWINDTGAYIVGYFFGRRKLIERISPKKTWEGLFGGFVFAFLVTFLFGKYFTEIPRMDQWILTVAIVLFGTFGDLIESMWKRSLGIKDSGNVLPGHGGWLDRLDSILMAVPAAYITIIILNAI